MYEENEIHEGGDDSVKATNKTKKYIGILLALLVIIGGGYLAAQKSETFRSVFGMKPKTDQEAVSRYLAQLGKLMVVPKDDTPVLATVEDPDALVKQQAFFQGSQKGDVVLIFPKTSRAVLFSPKRNIIVNAGPLIQSQDQLTGNVSQQAPQTSQTPPTSQTPQNP